jgi:hypothetical protein
MRSCQQSKTLNKDLDIKFKVKRKLKRRVYPLSSSVSPMREDFKVLGTYKTNMKSSFNSSVKRRVTKGTIDS